MNYLRYSPLDLLKTLPDALQRVQQELTLQVALGVPLQATKGYGSPEVGNTYERARMLCQQGGETVQHFVALRGVAVFYYARAELGLSRELGEQLLPLAQRMEDSALLLEAHRALGMTLLNLGELVAARAHAEQAIALYDPQKHHSLALLYAFDPGVITLVSHAWTLWLLGYPNQARKTCQAALTLAQERRHPYSLALTLGLTALVHQLCRERQAAQERAEAAMALCDEHGFRDLGLMAAVFWRWALAEKKPSKVEVSQLHQSMDAYRDTGSEAGRRHFLALLAEGYGKVGQIELGLRVLAEALDTVKKTEEHRDEAELYRLKGELTLQQATQKSKDKNQKSKVETNPQPLTPSTQAEVEHKAEECFLTAIEIARRQQAKSWELRVTVSLARLWQQQGKTTEAHRMLAEIYDWFTEGFDTKDLQEAKALLEALQ